MTYQQLAYAIAVEAYGSFSLAAEHCFVTQPTLSQQVSKLEDELGLLLFDRGKKPVQATSLGARILLEARQSNAGIARIEAMVAEEQGRRDGDLRIGIIPTLAPYMLSTIVVGLRAAFPELRLDVRELLTDQLIVGLKSGDLDIGLCAGNVDETGLENYDLFEDEFVVFLESGNQLLARGELRPDELDRGTMLLLQEGHCFRDQVLSFCPKAAKVSGMRLESGSFETLCNLVDSGLGYTLLPRIALPSLSTSRRSRVRRFASPRPSRQLKLLCQTGYPRFGLREAVRGLALGLKASAWPA